MSNWFGLDARAARVTLTVLVFAVVLALLYLLRHVVVLLAFSVFFAYLLYPLVRLVQRIAPLATHRTTAIGVVYGLLLIAVTAVGMLTGPKLTAELSNLARRLPEISEQVQTGTIAADMLEARSEGRARAPRGDVSARARGWHPGLRGGGGDGGARVAGGRVDAGAHPHLRVFRPQGRRDDHGVDHQSLRDAPQP
jgi:hypothetical protein